MHAAPRTGMIHRVVQMEHLVEHHVFEREARRAWIVEYPADHNCVVRRIEVAKSRARTHQAPANRRPRPHAAEVFSVDLLEDLFQVMPRPLRTGVQLPAPLLPRQTDLAPYIFPIEVEPVTMR